MRGCNGSGRGAERVCAPLTRADGLLCHCRLGVGGVRRVLLALGGRTWPLLYGRVEPGYSEGLLAELAKIRTRRADGWLRIRGRLRSRPGGGGVGDRLGQGVRGNRWLPGLVSLPGASD